MSDFDRLLRAFLDLKHEVAELRHQAANSFKPAVVHETDGKKGYRLKYGEGADGKPILSPWHPHPEAGGALKTWFPMTEGEIVYALHPSGDARQGYILRGGFSDQNKQPSEKTDENVVTFGKFRMVMAESGVVMSFDEKNSISLGSKITLKVGDLSYELGSDHVLKGGKVKHENKDIGSTHKHGGVEPGGAKTQPPDE